ncbi:hypothetical protein [Streptomyces sp. NPDC055058]
MKAQAKKRADAERRKKDGIFGNIMKGNWGTAWNQSKSGLHDTFGTWDGWKNRVIPAVGFGACVVVSVGACIGVEAAAATAVLIGDRATTGDWDFKTWGKSLTWGAFGGFAAFKFARWGGNTTIQALRNSATARNSVRVRPTTTTSGAIWTDGSVNWAATRANMGINSGFNFGFCGAGSQSVGSVFGSC